MLFGVDTYPRARTVAGVMFSWFGSMARSWTKIPAAWVPVLGDPPDTAAVRVPDPLVANSTLIARCCMVFVPVRPEVHMSTPPPSAAVEWRRLYPVHAVVEKSPVAMTKAMAMSLHPATVIDLLTRVRLVSLVVS